MLTCMKKNRYCEPALTDYTVFYACHPDDFYLYRDTVFPYISSNNSIVVWFEEPGTPYCKLDSLEAVLSRTGLVVVAVSQRFLSESNRAKDFICPYAREHHIPLLPLIMGDVSDSQYEKIFGTFQYLAPDRTEVAAIPSEIKVNNFIDQALWPDGMAERVLNEFKGQLFLSYRKKDRVYAERLMHMLHQDERFRELSIWYDEYLIPGEEFNEEIENKILESKAVILLVTRSIFDTNNYVLKKEIPLAIKANKPIIAVMMDRTKERHLKKVFPGVTLIVSKTHPNLPAVLEQVLGQYAVEGVKEVSQNPEHDFLVGLAYLDGIHVEKKPNLALRLIESSARAEYLEAIWKLEFIYQNGYGLEKNFEKYLQWKEKHLEIDGKREDNSPTLKKRLQISGLFEIGDAYRRLKRYKEAEDAYAKAFNISGRMALAPFDSIKKDADNDSCYVLDVYHKHEEASERLADILLKQGDKENAKKILEHHLIVIDIIKNAPLEEAESERSVRDLDREATVYWNLGNLEDDLGNPEKAIGYYELAISCIYDYAHDSLGDIWECLEYLDECIEYYSENAYEHGHIVDRLDPLHFYQFLRDILYRYGLVNQKCGRLETATKSLNAAKRISEYILKE